MSSDERILRLENAMATLAESGANHEQRIERLEEISRSLHQIIAEQQKALADQQRRVTRLDESFVKLVEVTTRIGEGMNELRVAQAESERKIAALAEAQAHSDRRLDALIDIVQGWRNGQPPSS